MYSRPHDQQHELYFFNCVHSAGAIEKVAIFASKYSYSNIYVQQKQQLPYAGFSTIKLPLMHHKNRFNHDICNYIAVFEG